MIVFSKNDCSNIVNQESKYLGGKSKAIVGGVIAAVAVIIIIVAVAIFGVRHQWRKMEGSDTEIGAMTI